ncbi:hypothetical protein C0991_003246, partial [Blastosporella zonata]
MEVDAVVEMEEGQLRQISAIEQVQRVVERHGQQISELQTLADNCGNEITNATTKFTWHGHALYQLGHDMEDVMPRMDEYEQQISELEESI